MARSVSSRVKAVLQRAVLTWFREHARDLPWRGTRDLYRIWISEIMLQQTQVVTVIDYYRRFLARFPDVQTLAQVSEAEVLRFWEGLGYYRRARQLHAASRVICEQHGGKFPEAFQQVLSLPGIGRYTAGAILSIGRDQPLPILEANTIRVWSRWLAYAEETHTPTAQKLLWQTAEDALPSENVGLFNQALMEIGALICTPREPNCEACPLQASCGAFEAGLQQVLPKPKIKTAYEDVQQTAVLLHNREGKCLLRLHPAGEHWAGLWDFPRISSNLLNSEQLRADIQQATGQTIQTWQHVHTLKHGVTKYRITLDVVFAQVAKSTKKFPATAEFRWYEQNELAELPMNTSGRKIVRLWLTQTAK